MKKVNPAQLALPHLGCLTLKVMSSLLLVTVGDVTCVAKCWLIDGGHELDMEWLYTVEPLIIGRLHFLERLRQAHSLSWFSQTFGTTYVKRCSAKMAYGIMPLLSRYTLTVLGSLTFTSSHSKRLGHGSKTVQHMQVLDTWQLKT